MGHEGSRPSRPEIKAAIFCKRGNAKDGVWGIITAFGHGIEWVLDYVESHHWIFAVAVAGYVFYRHDRSPRACFDARDKRIDEVRRRLSVDY